MATPLPRHIELKLQQTLAQWRHWHCEPELGAAPEILGPLGHGLSNYSFLVEVGPRMVGPRQAGPRMVAPQKVEPGMARSQFVVRIDGINPAGNGLNRQAEWRALQSASAAGLAPQARYFNPDLASLVCDYLAPDEQQSVNIPDLAALLRAIHGLPARHNRLDLADRILRYERQLQHAGHSAPGALSGSRQKVRELLAAVNRRPQHWVLCHNDLLRANRIYNEGKLRALDWEYCAMGSAWYELAVIVVGDALEPEATACLLENYLGRTPYAGEQADLWAHACIYRYLELLWYLCQDRTILGEAQIQEKLGDLERALLNPGSC